MSRVPRVMVGIFIVLGAASCGAGKANLKGDVAVAKPTATPHVGQKRKIAALDRQTLSVIQTNFDVWYNTRQNFQAELAKKYSLEGNWDINWDEGVLIFRGVPTPVPSPLPTATHNH